MDRFASDERIGRVAAPVLIVATPDDEVVPFAQSRQLFDLARSPKQLVPIESAGHNAPALAGGPRLMAAIAEFLESLPDYP